jgi:PTH1 family peptidyl-tRNA hydrolase
LKLIVGIGNPGKKYLTTRHNIGFMVLDRFAEKNNLSFRPSKFDFYQTGGELNSTRFLLMKPTTYVNNSGLAILDLLSDSPIPSEDILVIHDDINLNTGRIKVKKSGSSGGHNGLESIIYHLEKDDFPRIRFGIGSDFGKGEMADYVLDNFRPEETEILNSSIDFASILIENFILSGYKGMADYFSKCSNPPKEDKKAGEKEEL